MNLHGLTNALSRLQVSDRPDPNAPPSALYIALIHGFAARAHMRRNLLRFVRESGYPRTTLYRHLQSRLVADDLTAAAARSQKIVLIGYSQGGLESVRVVNELARRHIRIDLLVTIAAGGRGGRFWPHRWHDDPRTIGANVGRCLNYFSATDKLGTDAPFDRNLAVAVDAMTHVENIHFDEQAQISHLMMTKCYPASEVHPRIATDLLQRLQTECAILGNL